MVLATVPAAPPTRKKHRATSWPAPISAKVPYLLASTLICSAFWFVSNLPVAIIAFQYPDKRAGSEKDSRLLAERSFPQTQPSGTRQSAKNNLRHSGYGSHSPGQPGQFLPLFYLRRRDGLG